MLNVRDMKRPQSFIYRPTKLNYSRKRRRHTHMHRCLYFSHTLMMWSESQWNVMRFGSSDWLKKQEVNTFHKHSKSQHHKRPMRITDTAGLSQSVLAHDESSRDWINNGGWLKQPYQHCPRRQTKHLLSRNRFYTTRGGITSALWC